jgi:hypothetical protein
MEERRAIDAEVDEALAEVRIGETEMLEEMRIETEMREALQDQVD